MSKSVLIISASPRKNGNSDVLCNEFLKGAQSSGHTAEKIFLKDFSIHYCTGCGACVNNQGTCTQKDDMALLKDKMLAADVIVLATPIYFYTMCAQLKTFIDRNCFFYTQLENKEFYYIMTAAEGAQSAMDRAVTEFDGFLSCLSAVSVKGKLAAVGVWNVGDAQKTAFMKEAFTMGTGV